jgi:hypothetical protein
MTRAGKIGLGIILATSVLSCTKEVDNGLSDIPNIEILNVAPTVIQEFDGNVIVTLQYTDGNGDLGYIEADSFALEVKDARLSQADFYYVPPLAPVGHDLSIQGELDVKLNGTFILGNGNEEKTSFTLRIKDRAGNWSNLVTTPEITIIK